MSCNEKIILSSDSAFHHVVKNYGTNSSLTAKELHSFMNKLGLLKSPLKTFDCSVLNFIADLNNSNSFINSTMFAHFCSNILVVLEKDNYRFYETLDNYPPLESVSDNPSEGEIWGFGLLSVTIISLCSLVGISILPLMKSDSYDKVLLYLIALAVGTLSSNAMFQLIPEGFGINSNPMTVWQSAVIFGGFYLFYLVESILERIFNTSQNHTNIVPNLESNTTKLANNDNISQNQKNQLLCNGTEMLESKEVLLKLPSDSGVMNISESENSSEPSLRPASVLAAKQKHCWIFKNFRSIKTVAWMITVADGIHNFIDGLAIGASFSMSLVQGLSTSLAIFCEEFPHELGDFAILISSGMTIKQAAFYNFASACCCYLGLFMGILVGSDFSSAQWIFALAGGVFLYISLAGMLPEAQAHCTKRSLKHSPWLCLFIKNAGLLSGFVIMFLLTIYKDKISVG